MLRFEKISFSSASIGRCSSSFLLDLHQTTQSFDLPIFPTTAPALIPINFPVLPQVQKWCGVEQSRRQGVVARGQQRQGNAGSWATRPRSVMSAHRHERRSGAGMCLHEKRKLPLRRRQQCSRREHAIPCQLPAPPPPHTVAAVPSTPSRPRELRACCASGHKMRAYCWACPPLRPSFGTKNRGGIAGSRTADSHPRCAHWAERTALRIDHTIHFSECKKSHRSHNRWL